MLHALEFGGNRSFCCGVRASYASNSTVTSVFVCLSTTGVPDMGIDLLLYLVIIVFHRAIIMIMMQVGGCCY